MHHDDTDVTDELKEYVEDTECEDDMSEDEDDPDEDALFDFFLDLNIDTTLGIDLCEKTLTSMTTLLSRLDHGATSLILLEISKLLIFVDKTKKLDELVNISAKAKKSLKRPNADVIAWLNLYGPLVTLRNNGDLAQDPRCQDTDNVSVTIALADGAVKSILLPKTM
jgi:hypothetical protein